MREVSVPRPVQGSEGEPLADDVLLVCVCVCGRAGEEALSDSECDMYSVAGVLKIYFRGLEPPLFPYDSYPQLLDCVRKEL